MSLIDGYKIITDTEKRYLIKAEAYSGIFINNEQRGLVTEWLIKTNRITMARTNGRVTNHPTGRPKEQFKWPDGKRRRSFELVFKKASARAKSEAVVKEKK